jgi:hypothetical protein
VAGKGGEMRGLNGKVALVVVVMLGLMPLSAAACGGGSSEGLPKRALPENATPEKILLEGLNATDEAKSLHFKFDYSVIIPPTGEQPYTSEIALKSEGDYDAETGNAQGHLEWPAFKTSFDYRLCNGASYIYSADKDTWYEMPEGYNLSIPSISEISRNTAEYMDNFEKISRLEDEVVDGRDCYHIVIVPNFEAIMQNPQFLEMITGGAGQLDEEAKKKLEELKERLKEASVKYEYWIDKQYLVLRRNISNIEMTEKGEKQGSYTVKIISNIDFPTYNVKVDVSPPEKSQMYSGPSS